MIKNEIFENKDFLTTCVFGAGDIIITGFIDSNYTTGISFSNSEIKHTIGESILECVGKPLSEIDPKVMFIFNKVESIDVLIDILKGLKNKINETI
jgi:hypothetical protein